jgi:hypothetical protein
MASVNEDHFFMYPIDYTKINKSDDDNYNRGADNINYFIYHHFCIEGKGYPKSFNIDTDWPTYYSDYINYLDIYLLDQPYVDREILRTNIIMSMKMRDLTSCRK